MSDRPLDQPFEVSGQWHLPETPQQSIAGNLRYAPEHTELHLHDTFRPLRGTIRAGDSLQTYPLVHGVTEKGEAVTLVNAHRMGVSFNFGSGGLRQPERLMTTLLLMGAHMPSDFLYPTVSFGIPGLQVWHSRKNIDQSFDKDDKSGTSTLTFRLQRPPKEIIRIPSIGANLEWYVGYSSNTDPYRFIDVAVSASVTFRPDQPQALPWYLEKFAELNVMLTFLAGTPMSPNHIDASIDNARRYVSVMVALKDVSYCKYANPHEFFMPRADMGSDLDGVVARWFEIAPKVHMPSRLAMSIMASEKLWLHIEFLSLMQALEGFHRGLLDGNYMDSPDYEAIKTSLEAAIPKSLANDHKDALRSRIKYGNEVSLRKRLDQLADRLSGPIREMIFGVDRKIPHQWIETRNYYTHWDQALRSDVLDGQEMYYANVRMRHFLRALYLDLLGIGPGAILHSLSNASDSAQHLIQINAIQKREVDPNDQSASIMTISEQKASDVPGPSTTPSAPGKQ